MPHSANPDLPLLISPDTVVHCPTDALAREAMDAAGRLGACWGRGERFSRDDDSWGIHGENSAYDFHHGRVGNVILFRLYGHRVISAEDFIALHRHD